MLMFYQSSFFIKISHGTKSNASTSKYITEKKQKQRAPEKCLIIENVMKREELFKEAETETTEQRT